MAKAHILLSQAISTMASPASDSDNGVGNEFEDLDNEGTLTDITVSDSDKKYLLENYPDVSITVHSKVDE